MKAWEQTEIRGWAWLLGLLLFANILVAAGSELAPEEADPCVQYMLVAERIRSLHDQTWPETPPVRLTQDLQTRKLYFDGIPAKVFTAPPTHNRGLEHAQLLTLQRDGDMRFIKLFSPRDESEKLQAMRGPLIAQEFGGPKIYKIGRARTDFGQQLHYIEQEFLFPGQDSFTLKWRHTASNRLGKDWDYFLKGTPSPSTQLAGYLAHALEHNVGIGLDFDFMVSGTQIRVFDTVDWYWYVGCPYSLVSGLQHFLQRPGLPKPFFSDLKAALLRSRILSDTDKQRLISVLSLSADLSP